MAYRSKSLVHRKKLSRKASSKSFRKSTSPSMSRRNAMIARGGYRI